MLYLIYTKFGNSKCNIFQIFLAQKWIVNEYELESESESILITVCAQINQIRVRCDSPVRWKSSASIHDVNVQEFMVKFKLLTQLSIGYSAVYYNVYYII